MPLTATKPSYGCFAKALPLLQLQARHYVQEINK